VECDDAGAVKIGFEQVTKNQLDAMDRDLLPMLFYDPLRRRYGELPTFSGGKRCSSDRL
jgi:hypothetical protein